MRMMNILVIDDDANIRKLLQEMLAARPEYRVLMAGEGKQAVRYFAEEKIDVVLTDIHMPGFTGLELMSDMLKLKFRPEILVMTANATPENVEKARKIGARSVILKPFDNLDVVEAEIEKAVRAVLEATSGRTDGDASRTQPEAAAQAGGDPGDIGSLTVRQTLPAMPAAPPARPAPAPKPAAPVRPPARPAPSPVATVQEEPAAQETGEAIPDFDAWKADLSGNETPAARPAQTAAPKAPPAAPAARVAPAPPKPAAPIPARAAAPPAPRPPAPKPPATRPATPAPEAVSAEPAAFVNEQAATGNADSGPAAAAHTAAEIPEMPRDLDDIFQMVANLDVGKMQIQVPIICLQTWEEKGAVQALQQKAAVLKREFYTWSAARGIMKDNTHPMGETYRDPARALEFIRRQKNQGLYMLADFRQCLEDRTVVRVLREMVMEMETTRALIVITAPRLPIPPELAPACSTFDWPGGGTVDLEGLYEEVMTEVVASSGQPVRLDRPTRDALLQRVKEMPAGRARFEIARALMALLKRAS